jgi:hypothetical protein
VHKLLLTPSVQTSSKSKLLLVNFDQSAPLSYSFHPAASHEATKLLQPTPQVCRPPPFPSGREGLIYGIRCGWGIPP